MNQPDRKKLQRRNEEEEKRRKKDTNTMTMREIKEADRARQIERQIGR